MRQKIAALVATGLTYKQAAKAIGMTKWSIWFHMSILKKVQAPETTDPIEPVSFCGRD
jgi:DNA-binding CsgD family transcriptional regulator